MTGYVALLRAVNVGGTGKLPMAVLSAMGAAAGFASVRTYIASGNLVFCSDRTEADVRRELEGRLAAYAGRKVGVLVRTGAEMASVVAGNPFAGAPGNRVMVLFVADALPDGALAGATGLRDEQVRLGERELFVFYPGGMAQTRLRLPADRLGTARNMNTVAKLAEMAASP